MKKYLVGSLKRPPRSNDRLLSQSLRNHSRIHIPYILIGCVGWQRLIPLSLHFALINASFFIHKSLLNKSSIQVAWQWPFLPMKIIYRTPNWWLQADVVNFLLYICRELNLNCRWKKRLRHLAVPVVLRFAGKKSWRTIDDWPFAS